MAKKGTEKAPKIVPADEIKLEIEAQKAAQDEKRVNPYKDYPLSVCTLLRAVLCELWELRQDIAKK